MESMKKTLSFVVAALIAALPGAVFAQSRQDQQLAASMLMIQEQQQLTALAVAQLAEMVKAMNPRFDEVVDSLRKQLAGLEQTIKNVGPEISAIRTQSQENGTRIGSLKDEIDALNKTMADLLQQIIKLQVPVPAPVIDPNAPPVSQGATPGAPAAVPPTQTVTMPPQAGLSPQRLFSESMADYAAGRFTVAITGFEQYIKSFPDTQAAPEAQYLIGESYASEGNWSDAIAAYNAVIQRYPRSSWVAMAYYRKGLAESRAGQPEASRASFEYVVKTYPGTEGAILAKQRLSAPPRP
jgi:tol-pal system protein YbgF